MPGTYHHIFQLIGRGDEPHGVGWGGHVERLVADTSHRQGEVGLAGCGDSAVVGRKAKNHARTAEYCGAAHRAGVGCIDHNYGTCTKSHKREQKKNNMLHKIDFKPQTYNIISDSQTI